jgi:hypothetical protein
MKLIRLFSRGLVASIVRFALLSKIVSSPDISWIASRLYIATLAESGCYLISACLPRCRPVLDVAVNSRMIQSLIHRTSSKTSSSKTGGPRLHHDTSSDIQLQPHKPSMARNISIQVTGQSDSFERIEGLNDHPSNITVQKSFQQQEEDVENGKN